MPLIRIIILLGALAMAVGCVIPTATERRFGIDGIVGEPGADGFAEELVREGPGSGGAWAFFRESRDGPVAVRFLAETARDPEDFFHRIAEESAEPGETRLTLFARRISAEELAAAAFRAEPMALMLGVPAPMYADRAQGVPAVLADLPMRRASCRRLDCELVEELAVVGMRRRSIFAVATYPVWGLPRDLLDAPWTAVRRHRWFRRPSTIQSPNPPTVIVMGASGLAIATGTAILVVTTVSPPALAIPLAVVAFVVPGAVPAGFFGGYGIGAATELAVMGTTRYIEVPLLRSGINSEHYFPNWKFIAHAPDLVPSGRQRWLVTGTNNEWQLLQDR